MNKYEVIIYWSNEDEAFIAEVPELAGCMADGTTYQEALANAETAIQKWIETAKEDVRFQNRRDAVYSLRKISIVQHFNSLNIN